MNASDMIYRSGSKGDVRIGDMATAHLMNAWRKNGARIKEGDGPLTQLIEVQHAMATELESRGGTYNADTDQWEFAPKEEAAP